MIVRFSASAAASQAGPIRLADLLQHHHDRLVGAAVQRALERPDRPGDRGVEVGESRGDDPRGEGGGIETVLGVEDERDLETA